MCIKTVIVDDEQQALDLLSTYCHQTAEIELLGSFTDPMEAMNFINNNAIDLLISDIDMPIMSGVELRKSLLSPIATIFITAHSEYAIDGYDLEVVDYLLKPVVFSRFLKAINKVSQQVNTTEKINPPVTTPTDSLISTEFIFVKVNGARIRINIKDIYYIESQRDYIIIHQKTKHYMVLKTLTQILKTISNPLFVRIHRSFIVNLAHVDLIEKDHLIINDIDLTIGKKFRTELLTKLD